MTTICDRAKATRCRSWSGPEIAFRKNAAWVRNGVKLSRKQAGGERCRDQQQCHRCQSERIARLHLEKIGVKLTKLSKKQAENNS